MSKAPNSSPRANEQGQLFSAWILGIFIIAAMIIYVADSIRRARLSTQNIIYRELALNVAQAGFEEGLSYFRTHPNGSFLSSSEAPTSQSWVTPWPVYPDASFLPQSTDTEFYSDISVSTSLGVTCAAGIIGDVPMDAYVTYTAEDQSSSQLWGRYVLRRQNVQNWSPGPDTATVNTDADACHDISAMTSQSTLGAGTRWSIVSKGYIVRLPQPITATTSAGVPSAASSLLGVAAAFQGDDLLSAPLSYYNGQPFLLASARVYGEVSRLNISLPSAAVLVPYNATTPTLLVNTNGYLSAGSNAADYADASNTGTLSPGGTCGAPCINGNLDPIAASTSLSSVFPGQTLANLASTALALEGVQQSSGNTQIVGWTNANQLPLLGEYNANTGLSFTTQTTMPAFYYLSAPTGITLTAGGLGSTVLSGVGLCVINGSLTIQSGNASLWNGILYATGQITLDGPTINGIVISEVGISIGNAGDLYPTTVTYDPDAVTVVQDLLQGFTVDSSSIVATQF